MKPNPIKYETTPKQRASSIIQTNGQALLGHFAAPVDHINGSDADYRTVMNKTASKLKKHFSYKQFQYFGAVGEDLIFGCAFADIRYIGACFVYLFRPSDGAMRTWQYKTPLALGLNMTARTDNGESIFRLGAKHAVQRYTLDPQGVRSKTLEIDFGSSLQIKASMTEPADYETLALCTPCAVNGWIYAQKTAALPVTGRIESELGNFDLDTLQCFGHHDFSAGFMRRETFWNWACISAPANSEREALGLNISWGVNETGYSENCLWIGNRCHKLPQVQFYFERDQLMNPWTIRSADGRIELHFESSGKHSEILNLGFLATNFHQIFGRFSGHVTDEDGIKHPIKECFGFVEDQFSRW
jgi:Domain of unknown function (DUF2804), C-terminal/Domain of unknown function (DUF2804), N-terminal